MPSRLKRIYGFHDLHFITGSCYQRKPLLGTPQARDFSLSEFERVRNKYCFEVVGYVVMPEHFHALIGEPEEGTPSTPLQVLKQDVAKELLKTYSRTQNTKFARNGSKTKPERHFWYPRFYDFNVYSEKKVVEKLRYMHRNPVKRGLVSAPELWAWSSFRAYAFGEESVVKIERLNPNPMIRWKEPNIKE